MFDYGPPVPKIEPVETKELTKEDMEKILEEDRKKLKEEMEKRFGKSVNHTSIGSPDP